MTLDIIRVDSLREAAALLAAEPGARLLGGGTLVMRDVNAGRSAFERLVLTDQLDLDRIDADGDPVVLGAAVTMAAVARHPRLAFLGAVAGSIGGPAVRGMATVGGNLFAPTPFGDFTVALLALGAELAIEDVDGQRTVPIDDFIAAPDAAPFSIVRSIAFARPPRDAFRFVKAVRRRPHGAPVLTIAALLPLADGNVTGARIAYGALADKPMRAGAVEQALEGHPLDEESIERAVRVATDGCRPRSDALASAWYRLAVLPVHLKRLLTG